jgi:hypothetical protein
MQQPQQLRSVAGTYPRQGASNHPDVADDVPDASEVHERRLTSGRKRQFTRPSPNKHHVTTEAYPPYASLPRESADSESDMSTGHATQPLSQTNHRSTVWTPENPYGNDPPSPIYPDHPNHPLHECTKELSFDSSQIADDREQSSLHHSYYESTPGILAEDIISNDQLQDIASQHQERRQASIQSAESHTEMRPVAIHPTQEDQAWLARPESPGTTNPMQSK